MTREEVLVLADRVVRPEFGDREIERIAVREDEDWSGAPSIYIDVSVAPGTRALDAETSMRLLRTLNREVIAAGDPRVPYLRLRDEAEERREDEGMGA